MIFLSDREVLVLRQCAGEVVELPYDGETSRATDALVRVGLVVRTMEDDQPTAIVTEAGRQWLAQHQSPRRAWLSSQTLHAMTVLRQAELPSGSEQWRSADGRLLHVDDCIEDGVVLDHPPIEGHLRDQRIISSLEAELGRVCMERDALKSLPRWRHHRGGDYEMLAESATHSETGDEYVVYRSLADGTVWLLPSAMFHEQLPDGRQRFMPIDRRR